MVDDFGVEIPFSFFHVLRWAKHERVLITIDLKNIDGRYEIDGCLFRSGTYECIFKNGKKCGRRKTSFSNSFIEEEIAMVWIKKRGLQDFMYVSDFVKSVLDFNKKI